MTEVGLFDDIAEEAVVYQRVRRLGRAEAPPPGFIEFWTDGSSLKMGAAGWGWWSHAESWACGGYVAGTNNIGELQAIIEVLKEAPANQDIIIASDSKYAIGAAWEWVDGWRKRGWVKGDKQIPSNLDMVKEATLLLEARTGETLFRHVRGHGRDTKMRAEDVNGNDQADALATQASARAAKGDATKRGPGWIPAG